MVALRLTKIGLAMGLLSFGLLVGCQSKQPAAQHDLPPITPAPAAAPEASAPTLPPPPAAAPEVTPAPETQPVDVTLNPDKPVKHGKVKPAAATKAPAPAASGKRDLNLWYLVVASDTTHAKYLDEYASYLNAHGVAVTVDKLGDHYAVRSTQGFASATANEAKALKTKVVAMGKDYPEAKKAKKPVWQDAYFLPPHGHKPAATKPATKK